MSRSKITLPELHEHLVQTSIKDDTHFSIMTPADKTKYFEDNFKDPEYYQDNWHKDQLALPKLVVAHPEFRSEVTLIKEQTYVAQWPAIKAQLAQHWVLPYEVCATGVYPPIVAREDARKGLYRVWDGQRRTLSCLWHELDTVRAYVFIEP